VHGGLSPEIITLDQIRTIERNGEIPYKGAFCDLVWSDPEDMEYWGQSPRGAGWLFGHNVTKDFMAINNLDLICRAQLGDVGWWPKMAKRAKKAAERTSQVEYQNGRA